MPDSLAQLASLLAQPKKGLAPLPTTPLEQTNPWLAKARDFTQGLLGLKQDPGATASGVGALMGAALPAAGMIKGLPGFYSRLERAVAGLPDMAHPNKVLSTAKNLASGEEIAARKLGEFLAGQKGPVARSAVEAHLAANPLPELRKTVVRDPQYGNYQVPGGTDYQETLLQVPTKAVGDPRQPGQVAAEMFPGRQWHDLLPDEQHQVLNKMDYYGQVAQGEKAFRSSHFSDHPNLLVHTRSNTHTLPTGEPGMLIENVQSDWHQKGRKFGYGDSDLAARVAEKDAALQRSTDSFTQWREATRRQGTDTANVPYYDWPRGPEYAQYHAARQQELEAINAHLVAGLTVPDAPFKDSWPNLAMKQAVLDAANHPTAEWIGITPSETLRARGEMISPEFQDQRLPLTLEKILAPFGGGKVEQGAVVADRGTLDPNTAPAWLAKLTPEMKQRILKEGLPLLSMVLAAQQLKPAPKQHP